jgi:hypothetical protein
VAKSKKRVSRPNVKNKETPKPRGLPGAETSDKRICWRFKHVDHEGPWGFDQVDGKTLCAIMERLAHFEGMTVNELFNTNGYPGKDYDIPAIPNRTALDRLEACGLEDQTKIWCLRFSGEKRLFGILEDNIFHVIWWDPEHQVWPSKLKHT